MSTLAMKMFLGAPIELEPPALSFERLMAFAGRLAVLVGVLFVAAAFWGTMAWVVDQIPMVIASYQAVYIEGMDPVLPEYYSGWGR